MRRVVSSRCAITAPPVSKALMETRISARTPASDFRMPLSNRVKLLVTKMVSRSDSRTHSASVRARRQLQDGSLFPPRPQKSLICRQRLQIRRQDLMVQFVPEPAARGIDPRRKRRARREAVSVAESLSCRQAADLNRSVVRLSNGRPPALPARTNCGREGTKSFRPSYSLEAPRRVKIQNLVAGLRLTTLAGRWHLLLRPWTLPTEHYPRTGLFTLSRYWLQEFLPRSHHREPRTNSMAQISWCLLTSASRKTLLCDAVTACCRRQ